MTLSDRPIDLQVADYMQALRWIRSDDGPTRCAGIKAMQSLQESAYASIRRAARNSIEPHTVKPCEVVSLPTLNEVPCDVEPWGAA